MQWQKLCGAQIYGTLFIAMTLCSAPPSFAQNSLADQYNALRSSSSSNSSAPNAYSNQYPYAGQGNPVMPGGIAPGGNYVYGRQRPPFPGAFNQKPSQEGLPPGYRTDGGGTSSGIRVKNAVEDVVYPKDIPAATLARLRSAHDDSPVSNLRSVLMQNFPVSLGGNDVETFELPTILKKANGPRVNPAGTYAGGTFHSRGGLIGHGQ